jgi:hypothetical protein
MIALVKKLKKSVPTLIGYNISGFDMHFIMQNILRDPIASQRFKLNMIYKGSSLIFFQLFDVRSQEIVLKTHDMYQICGCSLKTALVNFCGHEGQDAAKKIEFRDEILYVYHNYAKQPEMLKPGTTT